MLIVSVVADPYGKRDAKLRLLEEALLSLVFSERILWKKQSADARTPVGIVTQLRLHSQLHDPPTPNSSLHTLPANHRPVADEAVYELVVR